MNLSDSKELNNRISTLENSENKHFITNASSAKEIDNRAYEPNTMEGEAGRKANNNEPVGSLTRYNPDIKEDVSGQERTPRVALAHELLGHGYTKTKELLNQELLKTALILKRLMLSTSKTKRANYREMLNEQNMEEKKFQKKIWMKNPRTKTLAITMFFVLFTILRCTNNSEKIFYYKVLNDFSDHSYFVALKIKYNSTTCDVIIENADLFFYLNKRRGVQADDYINW